MSCEPEGPGDNQACDCCVNPRDQAVDCCVNSKDQAGDCCVNPKDQAGDCCVNPKDQEITRRVIVAESLFVKMVAESIQPFLSAGGPLQESREGDVSR